MIELEKAMLEKLEHLHGMLHGYVNQYAKDRESIDRKLNTLIWQGRKLMATQAELAEQVKKIGDSITKIGTETTTLLAKIDELNAIITNGPAVTPELQAAVDAVAAQAKVVDDLVPDAPPV